MNRYLSLIRYFSNWPQYFLDKILNRKSITYKARSGSFNVMVPVALRPVFKEIFFEDFYKIDLILSHLKTKSPVVLDIGANAGYFAALMGTCDLEPKVFCFEPVPANIEILQKNAEFLSAGTKKPLISVHQMAITKEGVDSITLNLKTTDDLTVSASAVTKEASDVTLEVKATSLQALMQDETLSKIDVLKMDCEGSEYDILYNASPENLAAIGFIAMEVHELPTPKHNLKALKDFFMHNQFEVLDVLYVNDETSMLWAKNKGYAR